MVMGCSIFMYASPVKSRERTAAIHYILTTASPLPANRVFRKKHMITVLIIKVSLPMPLSLIMIMMATWIVICLPTLFVRLVIMTLLKISGSYPIHWVVINFIVMMTIIFLTLPPLRAFTAA